MAPKSSNASPSASRDQSGSATPSAPGPPDSLTQGSTATTVPSTSSTTQPSVSNSRPSAPETNAGSAADASQPMTKSMSSGSDPSAKDAAQDTASGYGTRSRNRNGTSRINYAEDKDVDVDMFDYYPDKKDGEPKKSRLSILPAQPATETSRSNGSSRKTAPSDDTKSSASQPATAKDATSASLSTAATATPGSSNGAQPSKKRKAAAQSSGSASGSASQAPSISSATTVAGASKRLAATSSDGVAQKGFSYSNMLTFASTEAFPKDGALVADDGTVLRQNDTVYLVCEPAGEPYYLGRIMEFLHAQNDKSKPVDALRLNWFYRQKDMGKPKGNDTRHVWATMHSDISPLTALRGKCTIKHRAEISSLHEYKKTPDSFWFEKLYDRYIQKNYDLIPTGKIVNVPEKVKKVLDECWKFVIVEQGRGKELTSAVKLCKRCIGYCASNDSVDCAVCKQTYHMNCVRPPLLKKPSRGFAWSCAACSRAQERKLEARHTPSHTDPHGDAEEDEVYDDDDDEMQGADTGRTSPANDDSHPHATEEQIHQASLWPWRYLGIHCKPEDALDFDDRIYPRASTRIGPRHQAAVLPWPGQPVQYMKPLEVKKSGKKDSKMTKEAFANYEAEKARREKLPKWFQDEPAGYVARGGDPDDNDKNSTATLLFAPPSANGDDEVADAEMDKYMAKAEKMAPRLPTRAVTTNMLDIASQAYFRNSYSEEAALKDLAVTEKKAYKEPELTAAEQRKFEEAVGKYGSELQVVTRHVKSVPYGMIVRHYYVWKKTKAGKQIWGNFQNRAAKKELKRAEAAATKLQDDIADDADDSAYDVEKADAQRKSFVCKFCHTKNSRQWRRAPMVSTGAVDSGAKTNQKDKGAQAVQALCRRCAELWRRYAIQWEDLEEVARKVTQAGGKAWKKKQDEEFLKELMSANDSLFPHVSPEPVSTPTSGLTASNGASTGEPPRKKLKGMPEKDIDPAASDSSATHPPPKRREKLVADKPAPPAPPPVPEIPKARVMPCAICDQMEPLGDQHLSCKECRMTVHRNCYGVTDNRITGKWTCDMCTNDKNPQVSTQYKCVLCPVDVREHDFVGPPKAVPTHKKKTEKEKERERIEREQAQKTADYYRKKQEETHRPVNPREPLKRTFDNNWVHVTCAVWTPEIKFGKAKALGPAEGISSIPRGRYSYLLGFDISPVKGSRRDQHNIVTINGESGAMSATIWCPEHVPSKTIVHRMHDVVNDNGQNALQLYVQNCKQADLTLTGTVRKANFITSAAKAGVASPLSQRRGSTTAPAPNGIHLFDDQTPVKKSGEKVCITCGVDVSPKWWPIESSDERELANGHFGTLGAEAQKFIDQRKSQCHKCRKARRKPNAHPPKDRTPPGDLGQRFPTTLPLGPAQLAAPLVRSPPLPLAEPRRQSLTSYQWAGPGPAPATASQHGSPTAPPPVTPTALPVQVVTVPPHQNHSGPTMPYGPPGPRYPDWHGRPPVQHASPPRQINGGPPGLQPSALGNLSSLRPPPMAIPPGPPIPPPATNGHHVQPLHNGLPPSPRRVEGHPALPHAPYMHTFHHGHPGHSAPSGGPVPPRGPETFSQSLIGQRSPFVNPHGSPPTSRDSLLGRDVREGPGPLSAPSMRPSEPPRPAGASTSPSLRNLLS
ncbi:hypothetical protein ACHAP1_000942 [Verticillium nonalfalfae]